MPGWIDAQVHIILGIVHDALPAVLLTKALSIEALCNIIGRLLLQSRASFWIPTDGYKFLIDHIPRCDMY